MILAGVVTYNPDIGKLKKCILSVYRQVNEVLVVDNASNNVDEIKKMLESINANIMLIENEDNFGIAKALNQILKYAVENKYEWFLTLDQDSVCNKHLIDKYRRYCFSNVAQISCNIRDKGKGAIIDGNHAGEVEYCITSGALNNTMKMQTVGGYDDTLFIDAVDIDISLRLRSQGYKIIKLGYAGLLHEIGSGKNVFNGILYMSHHTPLRNYYTRRNMILVSKKHYSGTKKYALIMKQVLYAIGSIVFDDNKLLRIKYNLCGIWDGLNGRTPIKRL